MSFFAPFCLPFMIGAAAMFALLAWKWGSWLWRLPQADKRLVARGIFTRATPEAVWETVRESLLHRRIFRIDPLLGYMHMSLALGWFLLICVGWIETVAYLGLRYVPLQGHVFFKY
ncbi:MAG: (Fe-S)-binding protein, partial [Alistipes sp.]|nr:(Fe-S)-binding protein [Alistipes sp.]